MGKKLLHYSSYQVSPQEWVSYTWDNSVLHVNVNGLSNFSALVQPVTVNVGRAGAASMNIVQEVEFVKTEAKIPYILRCLDKTPPPVLIFAERKQVIVASLPVGQMSGH